MVFNKLTLEKKFYPSEEQNRKRSETLKMAYKSGRRISWNKGKKTSEETKIKMSNALKGKKPYKMTEKIKHKIGIANKGKKHTEEQNLKQSISMKGKNTWMKGRKFSEEVRKRMSDALRGRKVSEETRKKIGDKQRGDKHYNWKGGISFEEYPREFSRELKLEIRKRDNFTCCLCGRTEREELEELDRVLCVNHIDYNKKNCLIKNLNTLCLRCNVKINRDRDYWTNYFNNYE